MEKTNRVISSTLRHTSCSHGWLKTANQVLFGAITVLLFILLMLVVLREAIVNNKEERFGPEDQSCYVNGCSIICTNTALQFGIDEPIAIAIKAADDGCEDEGLTISLNNPMFYDSAIPIHWMFILNINVSSLSITGGNLRYINANAFMSRTFRNLKTLTLESVTIDHFHQEVLVGLASLLELNIRSCYLYDISENVLRSVDETLQTLQIKESNKWDPRNVTGSLYLENLTVVDLSFNNFGRIIIKQTFQGLTKCRLLYLSSSGITAIGEGAFDYLNSISRINLNDNLLKTLPEHIFDRIVALSINFDLRIDLHDNPWDCKCQLEGIRQMYKHNYLMVDPLCTTPDYFNNRPFSSIDTFCYDETPTLSAYSGESPDNQTHDFYLNTLCNERFEQNLTINCDNPTEEHWPGTLYLFKNIVTLHKNETGEVVRLASDGEALSMTINTLFRMLERSPFEMIWFHSRCPNEIHCMTSVSHTLRMVNTQGDDYFFYCLVDKSTKIIMSENCFLYYNISTVEISTVSKRHIVGLIYAATVLVSIVVSALIVFYAVRQNPMLLKGSKRVLLVKHRIADAIVLPPEFRKKSKVVRSESPKSMWSNKSGTPSYISALQPTDDQLAVWRLSHLFDSQLTSIGRSEKTSLSALDCKENLENGEKGEITYSNIYGQYI